MSTVRQAIARVRGTHRLLSSDAQINDRVIAAELRSKAILLIKRDTDRRKLWNTVSLFTRIPCVKMESVPLADCCDFVSDKLISRSVEPLPKIGEGNFQYLIKGVYNSEGNTRINVITPDRYQNLLKINPNDKRIYAWLGEDKHIYCTDEFVDVLSVVAFFEEDVPATLLNPKCDCKTNQTVEELCKNPLDQPFKCPGYLEDSVVTLVSKSLLESYFRIPQDTSSDNRDGQTR